MSLVLGISLYAVDNYHHRRSLLGKAGRLSIVNPIYNLIVPSKKGELEIPSINESNTQNPKKSAKNLVLDMFILIKELLFNLRYMGVTCSAVIEALLIKGYLAFLSKHIEYQFRTTPSHSSIFMGVISLCSVILGAPLGAFFVKRFQMNGRQCAKFCCVLLSISSIFFLGLMLHCREPTIGKEKPFHSSSTHLVCFSSSRNDTFDADDSNGVRFRILQ